MAKWKSKKYKLPETHGWRAPPGYAIFVADAGACRFNVPQNWVIDPEEKTITFRDRPKPDDDCILQVTVMFLNARRDWTGLPLREIFEKVINDEHHGPRWPKPVQYVKRGDLEIVWQEAAVIDPVAQREAVNRSCLARADTIVPLITMDYWPEHAARYEPVWDEVLRSLTLGDFVKSISGPTLH